MRERADGRQQRVVRGQRAISLHGQVAASERRTPGETPYDIRVQAPGTEQRRLHEQASQLLALALAGVDEDRHAVGPRRLAGVARRDVDQPSGDRRRQQLEAPEPAGCHAGERTGTTIRLAAARIPHRRRPRAAAEEGAPLA